MTAGERRASGSLAMIFAARMLGLFLVLPVFALEAARYNKTAAAKLLGVTYRALRYKIQKLEIE